MQVDWACLTFHDLSTTQRLCFWLKVFIIVAHHCSCALITHYKTLPIPKLLSVLTRCYNTTSSPFKLEHNTGWGAACTKEKGWDIIEMVYFRTSTLLRDTKWSAHSYANTLGIVLGAITRHSDWYFKMSPCNLLLCSLLEFD